MPIENAFKYYVLIEMDLFYVPNLKKVKAGVYLSVIFESFDNVRHGFIFLFIGLTRGTICTL